MRHAFLLFACAQSAGCLMLVETCETEGANLLGGADFEEHTCWYDGDNHDWDEVFITDLVDSPGSGAPVFAANNLTPGSPVDELQLMQGPWFSSLRDAPLGLSEGDRYVITFLAMADPQRDLYVHVGTEDSQWTYQGVRINSTWTEHTVEGTAGDGDADDAFFELQLGGTTTGTIWMDDVSMELRP